MRRGNMVADVNVAVVNRIERLRDPALSRHEDRVREVSALLCEGIGATREFTSALVSAAGLHDIGKVAIPDRILMKPGPLDAEERAVMAEHTRIGSEMLAGSNDRLLDLAADVARHHHECFDGSGYPNGLRGEEIPLGARVVQVADVYDALRSLRPYKIPMTHRDAMNVILRGDLRTVPEKFDPRLLAALQRRDLDVARIYAAQRR